MSRYQIGDVPIKFLLSVGLAEKFALKQRRSKKINEFSFLRILRIFAVQ